MRISDWSSDVCSSDLPSEDTAQEYEGHVAQDAGLHLDFLHAVFHPFTTQDFERLVETVECRVGAQVLHRLDVREPEAASMTRLAEIQAVVDVPERVSTALLVTWRRAALKGHQESLDGRGGFHYSGHRVHEEDDRKSASGG